MRIRKSLLIMSLICSPMSQAENQAMTPQRLHTMIDNTTPASDNADLVAMEETVRQSLVNALKGEAPTLTRAQLKEVKQNATLADSAWLKASGYDFAKRANQQAGITLLSGFSALPQATLDASLKTVEAVNLNASEGQRRQAIVDAEGQDHLFFLADALGPKLGRAFIAAYQRGEINKAAALIKASEVSTSAAKKQFNYPRPFLVPGNTLHFVPDASIVKDNQPYRATEGAFPSGHTNTGYTDALLLGEMLPERFVPLMDRAARYGYSRMVLGVHYPLDLIGSRMVAQRNVAHYLNDVKYHALFDEAKQQLRSALEKACGTSLAACAGPAGDADPYASPQMDRFYRYTMTYHLPHAAVNASPVIVPEGAEALLEGPLPQLSAAKRRQLMVATALEGGYPLSGTTSEQNFWQRVNLPAAVNAARR
ncbi:acid phosphatase [Erwinia oleae]|uniref:acid phosphatase n=1 Tax=Erwinia oleae TaxID=796334 RepID=UPI000554E799|nr:phosphatase PAP2 family protein [Erwinia oleae]